MADLEERLRRLRGGAAATEPLPSDAEMLARVQQVVPRAGGRGAVVEGCHAVGEPAVGVGADHSRSRLLLVQHPSVRARARLRAQVGAGGHPAPVLCLRAFSVWARPRPGAGPVLCLRAAAAGAGPPMSCSIRDVEVGAPSGTLEQRNRAIANKAREDQLNELVRMKRAALSRAVETGGAIPNEDGPEKPATNSWD